MDGYGSGELTQFVVIWNKALFILFKMTYTESALSKLNKDDLIRVALDMQKNSKLHSVWYGKRTDWHEKRTIWAKKKLQ